MLATWILPREGSYFPSSLGTSPRPFLLTAWILNQEPLGLIASFCLPSLALPFVCVPLVIFRPARNYTLCEGKANWEVLDLAPERLGLSPGPALCFLMCIPCHSFTLSTVLQAHNSTCVRTKDWLLQRDCGSKNVSAFGRSS